MTKKGSSKLDIAIIHPDLGIGGAERRIVDAAVELASHGHNVHVFTAHHDQNRCFEETISGIPLHFNQCMLRWSAVIVLLDLLLAQHTTILRRIYRKPIDFIEEMTTGLIPPRKFEHLDKQGIRAAVLYPAVNVNQFDEPSNSYKQVPTYPPEFSLAMDKLITIGTQNGQ